MFGYSFGLWIKTQDIRGQAILAGAAHWSIDPESGEKSFVWDGTRKMERTDDGN